MLSGAHALPPSSIPAADASSRAAEKRSVSGTSLVDEPPITGEPLFFASRASESASAASLATGLSTNTGMPASRKGFA